MASTARERVAGEVRAELARRRMSVQKLAEETGISLQTLRRRVAGEYPFTYDELAAIAAYFDITVTELVARAEPQEAAS